MRWLPRVRFTIRSMIVAVAIVAVVTWGYDRYGGMLYSKAYFVGDLIPPAENRGVPVFSVELTWMAGRLKFEVTPDVWWVRRGSVIPFHSGRSLIVRLPDSGRRRVQAWLEHKRGRLEGRS